MKKYNDKQYVNAVFQKYLENIKNGIRAFENNKIQEFKGFSAEQLSGITYRAFLNEKDNKVLKDRVITPIEKLANENGIKIFTSQTAWKPHIIIAGLTCDLNIRNDKEDLFRQVANNQQIYKACQKLAGQEIIFDTLWGGNAIALAASNIPESIFYIRKNLAELGLKLGMKEHDVNNILHTTIARMGDNSYVDIDVMKNFGRGVLQLNDILSANPLKVTIDNFELMSNLEYATKFERGLPQSNL